MSQAERGSWREIQAEVLRRIQVREWPPGALIPNEADLAVEFDCARATVNRALRHLAEDGILERKRRSGTRVALLPVARAVLEIPILRHEIEQRGGAYGYALVTRESVPPPAPVAFAMGLEMEAPLLHLRATYMSDGAPYAFEDRWINLEVVPEAEGADFAALSANEWLLENVPYTRGILALRAGAAGGVAARCLGVAPGVPVLQTERTTWSFDGPITHLILSYAPGHRMITSIGAGPEAP